MRFITLDGRVGKNGVELKTTRNGKTYMKFSLANNSFSSGQNKTTWYDVVCYKPEFINGIGKYLKCGSFVYLRGDIETTANVDANNKIWINNYIMADMIEFPSVSKKDTQDDENELSTFTGGTPSSIYATTDQANVMESAQKQPKAKAKAKESTTESKQLTDEEKKVYETYTVNTDDDDLPF